jgi:hypothetical protein
MRTSGRYTLDNLSFTAPAKIGLKLLTLLKRRLFYLRYDTRQQSCVTEHFSVPEAGKLV